MKVIFQMELGGLVQYDEETLKVVIHDFIRDGWLVAPQNIKIVSTELEPDDEPDI